ncbi:MAG: metallophosphoesterase [Halobacteriota archaeon]
MRKLRHFRPPVFRRKMQLAMRTMSERMVSGEFEPGVFEVERVTVAMPGLDPAFDGYRIASIADIHLGQWLTAERLEGVIDIVNEQRPDLVAFMGDFFSYEVDRFADDMAHALGKLSPVDGCVAVLGNHDHWVGPAKVRAILRRAHVIELRNDVHTIRKGGGMLSVAGVDSVMAHADRLERVLTKLPPSGPAILLAHEPDFADVSATTGRFNLQISGHSHGGQFIIPGIGTLIRGPHARKYPHGRYQVGDMVHYTSRGIGTNVFWLRINCPPEITIFTLTPEGVPQ